MPGSCVSLLRRPKTKGPPNHDHDHFWVHLAGGHFSFLGYPRMTHQMPLLHNGTQRNRKDFSSDVPLTAVLVWHQMQNFFGRLCRGPPTIYRHHKGLRIKNGISKGVVYELSEPKRTAQNVYHPQDCSGDVHYGFCGGWCADCGVRLWLWLWLGRPWETPCFRYRYIGGLSVPMGFMFGSWLGKLVLSTCQASMNGGMFDIPPKAHW